MLFGIWVQVIHVSLKHSPEISTRDLQNSQKDSDSGPELCQAHTYWSKFGKGTFISTISFPVKVIFLCITSSVSPLKEWMKPCWVISHPTKLARAPVLGATAPLSGQQTTLHGDFLFSSYSLSLSTFLPQSVSPPKLWVTAVWPYFSVSPTLIPLPTPPAVHLVSWWYVVSGTTEMKFCFQLNLILIIGDSRERWLFSDRQGSEQPHPLCRFFHLWSSSLLSLPSSPLTSPSHEDPLESPCTLHCVVE